MSGFQYEINLSSPDDTCDFAQRLGGLLGPRDVLLFEGEIGAGKTHFARCLIQSLLLESEDVPSPTFTLVQTYDTSGFEIWHADLYRLTSPDEVVELGLTDAFETALCLVEWPDRLADLSPKNALSIFLEMTEIPGERRMVLRADDQRWANILDQIANG